MHDVCFSQKVGLIEAAKTNRWGHRDATMVQFCDGATIRKVEQEVASHIELDLDFPPAFTVAKS